MALTAQQRNNAQTERNLEGGIRMTSQNIPAGYMDTFAMNADYIRALWRYRIAHKPLALCNSRDRAAKQLISNSRLRRQAPLYMLKELINYEGNSTIVLLAEAADAHLRNFNVFSSLGETLSRVDTVSADEIVDAYAKMVAENLMAAILATLATAEKNWRLAYPMVVQTFIGANNHPLSLPNVGEIGEPIAVMSHIIGAYED